MRAYDRLRIQYRSYDALTLLAALQSLTVLLVLLIFPSNRQKTLSSVPDHLFAAVQGIASHVLSTGMLLHEEAFHVRPTWRIWAHIESKRRTLVCIYLLHFAYSSSQGRRYFDCLELGRVRAPGPKWLWQASDEKRWANLYTRWLAQWNGKELIQAELFLVEHGPVMDPRVEMWLEDADELSIVMMSISEYFSSAHPFFQVEFCVAGMFINRRCLISEWLLARKCGEGNLEGQVGRTDVGRRSTTHHRCLVPL